MAVKSDKNFPYCLFLLALSSHIYPESESWLICFAMTINSFYYSIISQCPSLRPPIRRSTPRFCNTCKSYFIPPKLTIGIA